NSLVNVSGEILNAVKSSLKVPCSFSKTTFGNRLFCALIPTDFLFKKREEVFVFSAKDEIPINPKKDNVKNAFDRIWLFFLIMDYMFNLFCLNWSSSSLSIPKAL